MAFEWKLDAESAKRDGVGGRIKEPGAYSGVLKQVYEIISPKKGSKGLHFSFEGLDGSKAEMDLWTHSPDGAPYLSAQTVNAMMVILKLRGFRTVQGKHKAYDFDLAKEVEKNGEIAPDFLNKPIGILVNIEEHYNVNSGKTSVKPVIVSVYDPETGFTASEILNKAIEPKMKANVEKGLRVVPDKSGSIQKAAMTTATGYEENTASSMSDAPWD